MKLKALTLLIGSCIALPSAAFDLSTAYELALQHDVQYQIEESNLTAAKAVLPQSEAGFKPQFSAQAKGSYFDSDNTSTATFSQTAVEASLQYSQVLYNEQSDASTQVAAASVVLAEHILTAAKNDLMIRTAEAYFAILTAKDNLKFAQIEKQSIARQLEQAEKRFEVGLTAITDVKEAGAKYDSAVAQELAAQNQFDISLQNLELITGPVDMADIQGLNSVFTLRSPQPETEQYWMEQSMQNNTAVLTAQANLAIASANRKKANKANGFTVNATGNFALTNEDYNTTGSNSGRDISLAIILNVPLSTGGLNAATLAEKEAKYQSAKDSLILQKRVAAQQARNLFLTIMSGISQVKALQQASNSSQVALEATNAGFEVGTRTSVDVLTSIKEAFRAKRDESSARYDYLVNMLKLKQASGLLSINDIKETDQFIAR